MNKRLFFASVCLSVYPSINPSPPLRPWASLSSFTCAFFPCKDGGGGVDDDDDDDVVADTMYVILNTIGNNH